MPPPLPPFEPASTPEERLTMMCFSRITKLGGSLVKFAVLLAAGWMAILLVGSQGGADDRQPPPPAVASPTATPPEPPVADRLLPEDPLYQAIVEELRSGRQSLAMPGLSRDSSRPVTEDASSGKGSTTEHECDQDWLAIEWILKAARLLDRETVRREKELTAERLAQRRAWAMMLRRQVQDILQGSGSAASR